MKIKIGNRIICEKNPTYFRLLLIFSSKVRLIATIRPALKRLLMIDDIIGWITITL